MTNTTKQHPGLFHGHDGEYVTADMIAEEIYKNLINGTYTSKLSQEQLLSTNYFDHISYRVQELDPDFPDLFFDELCLTLGTASNTGIFPKVVKPHIVRVRSYTRDQLQSYREGLRKARESKDDARISEMTKIYDTFLFPEEEIINCIIDWLQNEQRQFFKIWQDSYHENRS